MCIFYLTTDHDSEGCLEMAHMMKLLSTNELNAMASGPELDSYLNGDSSNSFLEYKLNLEGQGECYATIDGTSYAMLTWSLKNKGQASN